MAKLEIVYKKTSELIPYENNPRKNDSGVIKVARSIEEFGFRVPITIDRSDKVVAGDTRLKAAKRLGMEEVPCIYADGLTPEQVKAFRLIDNRVSDYTFWDDGKLEQEIDELLSEGIDLSDFFGDGKAGFGGELDEPEPEPEEDKAEVPFSEELLEEHNYVVLYFDNEVDWLQAMSLFQLERVRNLSTSKDGKGNRKRIGLGRVVRGADFLKRIADGILAGDRK